MYTLYLITCFEDFVRTFEINLCLDVLLVAIGAKKGEVPNCSIVTQIQFCKMLIKGKT